MPKETAAPAPKAEPASMEELVSELQKPFEFKLPSEEGDATGNDDGSITPDVTPAPAPQAQENQKPTPEAQKSAPTEKPDTRSILEGLSKIGEKNLELGKPSAKTPENATTEAPKIGERDYTGFTEREAQLLKRMSNESFDFVSRELRESRAAKAKYESEVKAREEELTKLRTGKVEIPENYYENPDAVILTPEFKQAQENYALAQNVENHWAKQLAQLEKGEDWVDLDNDPKTGEIVYGKSHEPTPEARAYIQRQLSGAQNQTFRIGGELKSVVEGFQSRAGEFRNRIRDAEKTYMPYFEDDKGEAYKVYQSVLPEVKKLGLSEANPAFTMLAKSIALNMMLSENLNKLAQERGKAQSLQKDMKKAGPSAADFDSGGSNTPSSPKKLSFSEMDKLMHTLG